MTRGDKTNHVYPLWWCGESIYIDWATSASRGWSWRKGYLKRRVKPVHMPRIGGVSSTGEGSSSKAHDQRDRSGNFYG